MANKLEKLPPPAGGGGTGGGGSSEGPNAPGSGGGLPPRDSSCFLAIESRIKELWPFYTVRYVQPDQGGAYFRLSDMGEQYVYAVTGSCSKGYVRLNYTALRAPGQSTVT